MTTQLEQKIIAFDEWFGSIFDVPHTPMQSDVPKLKKRFLEVVRLQISCCKNFRLLQEFTNSCCERPKLDSELFMRCHVTVPLHLARGAYDKMLLLQSDYFFKKTGNVSNRRRQWEIMQALRSGQLT